MYRYEREKGGEIGRGRENYCLLFLCQSFSMSYRLPGRLLKKKSSYGNSTFFSTFLQHLIGEKILAEGEIYVQEREPEKRRSSADIPQSKAPVAVSHFKLLETPYISQLRFG